MPFHNMFFKVLRHPNVYDETKVTQSFVRKYWKGLSNPILLELPTGDEIKVKWSKKEDDSVWLNEGWKKVVELLGLKHEYFVIFKYNGESKFELIVFDKSASEIDYSSFRSFHNNDHHQGANRNLHDDDDQPIEIVNEKQEQFGRRNKAEACSERLQKFQSDSKIVPEKDNAPGKYNEPLLLTEFQCKRTVMMMNRAMDFYQNSKYPCFIQEMQTSYISQDMLRIPISFSREHLDGLEGKAKIGVNGNMKWDIELRFCGKRATFTAGWRNVSQNFALKCGDVCVFEMIKDSPLSFNIYFFRAREQAITPSHHNLLADHQSLNEPKKVQGQNSQSRKRKRSSEGTPLRILDRSPNMQVNQFVIQMKDFHLRGSTVFLPNEFSRSHKECLGKLVNLKFGEMLRPVKLLARGAFSEGWLHFAKECKLKTGDVCSFKLVDDQNLIFEVSTTKSK